jgi:hypothetical protein
MQGDARRRLKVQSAVAAKRVQKEQTDASTVAVFEKIETKRRVQHERALQLAREVKQRHVERNFWAANKKSVDAAKWKQQRAGVERVARTRQVGAIN